MIAHLIIGLRIHLFEFSRLLPEWHIPKSRPYIGREPHRRMPSPYPFHVLGVHFAICEMLSHLLHVPVHHSICRLMIRGAIQHWMIRPHPTPFDDLRLIRVHLLPYEVTAVLCLHNAFACCANISDDMITTSMRSSIAFPAKLFAAMFPDVPINPNFVSESLCAQSGDV